jgi:hypothetical protein
MTERYCLVLTYEESVRRTERSNKPFFRFTEIERVPRIIVTEVNLEIRCHVNVLLIEKSGESRELSHILVFHEDLPL